jgi:hypothetical protein
VGGTLGGCPIQLLVDTGASVNLVSLAWWQAHGGRRELTETVLFTMQQYWIPASILDFSATARPIDFPIELDEWQKTPLSV